MIHTVGQNLNDIMSTTLGKIKDIVDVNTIVGNPITTNDGACLIPISKITFGFASGGVDTEKGKSEENSFNFGGGGGAGASIIPVAFLLLAGETVKLIPIAPPASTATDRIVEIIPQLFDRVEGLVKQNDQPAGE